LASVVVAPLARMFLQNRLTHAQAPEDEREAPLRENVPDSEDEGEQTWPSEAEIADAQKMFKRRMNKHRVPEGAFVFGRVLSSRIR